MSHAGFGILGAVVIALSGCGLKGPLVLPPPAPAPQSKAPAPSSDTPQPERPADKRLDVPAANEPR
jgi:predicted small lipoprotein YifL